MGFLEEVATIAKSPTRRLTLHFRQKFDDLLTAQADESDASKADYIRRAVATYAYLQREAKDGGAVTVKTSNGEIKELILP